MGYQRRVHGDSSIETNRRTMIKIAIVACLAALAAAEADADAWYQPYGYSNWNNNWMGYNNWNMYNNWNRPGMQEGYRYNYGKRSAEAESEADADAWYRSYGYSNWGNNWTMYNNNWNMYSNMYNRPSYTQYRTFYHKRPADAEAEPEADAWYQPYGYSNWGYNGNNWWNRNNMMSYWNRPYNMYSNYRFYHF